MNNQRIDAAIVSGSDVPHDHYDSSSSSECPTSTPNNSLRQQHNHNPGDPPDMNPDMHPSDTSDDEADSRKYNIPNKDTLYNPNEDEEDEAYVYQHMRGGLEEIVSIRRNQKQNQNEMKNTNTNTNTNSSSTSGKNSSTGAKTRVANDTTTAGAQNNENGQDQGQGFSVEQAKLLKPRSSDAVLSCPCCFQIVCMDCQRHEQYSNQFRAMFVMNIGVSWDKHVNPENVNVNGDDNSRHDADADANMNMEDDGGPIVKKQRNQNDASEIVSIATSIPQNDEGGFHSSDAKEVYYSVHCGNCQTEVAALDMRDEVYHFFGCLVSS